MSQLDAYTSEHDFTSLVVAYARLRGWRVYHTWRSDHSEAGFPDLVMLRDQRLIIAELKRQKGKLTEAQEEWLRAFANAGVSWRVWRPADWPEIEKELE